LATLSYLAAVAAFSFDRPAIMGDSTRVGDAAAIMKSPVEENH
jgi:hypothetical protein